MRAADVFDVIVVGAGHAGCEAAHAAARMGLETCLITLHLETIAQMSCNPAIGGLAKGHLVREIDALGGLMGALADETGIHFRLLNRSRGRAVQAPRAQCDKAAYRHAMKRRLETVPKLRLLQGIVSGILEKGRRVQGVITLDGARLKAKAVILSPGTFLNGLIHIGLKSYPAGRANEPPSVDLARCLKELGFKIFRLKTGTPMRLDARTIAWNNFSPQPGDENPVPFSSQTKVKLENKIVCHAGRTNERTHEVIRKNLDKSPLYSGIIKGTGPRYCPSIEDKVVKFSHHPRHQFFLEPEGLDTVEVYVNGLSTSLPYEVQQEILRTIPGLDEAEILRPGYGIEYDAAAPGQIKETLESKTMAGLFLAGQINGTSGYEEAAAQGLLAGINAALMIKGQKPFVLRRDEAYAGVLIDDLISTEIEEPYRLFTSRAEYRLNLRIDNADSRLTPHGRRLGLIDAAGWEEFLGKQARIKKAMDRLQKVRIKNDRNETVSLKSHLKNPGIGFGSVVEYLKFDETLSDEEMRHIEAEIKYEGYLKKQEKEVSRLLKADRVRVPAGLDFEKIPGLTREAVEKLKKFEPKTLGEAKKLPGLTPAAITNLQLFLEADRAKGRRA
jgi:tRNA uridine 5-carboxymethylaminomethyl modification enzyme